MNASAVFISIGRGDTVDETALTDALLKGTISGAALDVFEKEPLAASSPLWSFDNCLISSHNADWTESYFEDSLRIFESNLKRFLDNQPLKNLVTRELGY
jgi:phosphoglycerate dehydrogenase-like enzyme